MLYIQKRNPKILSINIIVFGFLGMIYFSFFAMGKLEESLFHPLVYGWFGIWFSIVGAFSIRQFYRYRYVTLYKNGLYSIIYSILYFFGFFIFPLLLDREIAELMQSIWLALLLIAYFITFGALNWYFGFFIALANISLIVLSFINHSGAYTEPILWVSIFSFMGITNIYVQWGLVILTTVLGLLEKGFSMFDILEQ